MITFPVTVKILDFTLLQNALHGSKICINQEACTNIINDNLNEAQKIKIQFSDEVGYDSENAKKYLFRRIKAGHESVVEHIILVVEVSNISRAFLQQFARHRLLSMSVQSTRWALRTIIDDYIELVMPEEIKEDPDFKPYVIEWLSHGAVLVQKIRERYGNDVAKYLLPECIPTKILATGNMREWRHIYKLRKSPPAMKEFNDFCEVFYNALAELDPNFAEILVAEGE